MKWANGQINSTHHGPARYLIQRIDRQTDELHSSRVVDPTIEKKTDPPIIKKHKFIVFFPKTY